MTANDKIARRKLGLLELAKELSNVSRACRTLGYSRQQFYEIRRNFQTFGLEGLIDKLPGAKGPYPNRVAQEIEDKILKEALERFSPEFRERHIKSDFTGDLVAVDTFFVGHLKGVGKIYLQSAIDCYSRYAWGRLYNSKMPVTAVHALNESVLPTFDEHRASIKTVLSDNGREFCGRPESHPYELFLQMEGIEHRTTRVRRPQSNGFVERLHRTLLDEHFRIMGRTKWYESIDEMQADLDLYLHHYNHERPHQGRNMNGRKPYQVFIEGLPQESLDAA